MCGIAGLICKYPIISKNYISLMTDSLAHRGPDLGATYSLSLEQVNLSLGHRRLSIIDLSPNGNQPMVYENLILVYNGEVYNHKEIRCELESLGYSFKGQSDTEVVIKAFHMWGKKSLLKFNGMFSFSVFDTNKQVLTLVRDRAGVKPLYWRGSEKTFSFASELKGLLKAPEVTRNLNSGAIKLFLKLGYIPEPNTIFNDCFKLEAGSLLEFNVNTFDYVIEKYWDVAKGYLLPKMDSNPKELINATESLLISSCEYRMVADVPVGIFLSGGYDSTLVTALLQKDRSEKLKTFTIGFDNVHFNEAPFAKIIASRIGTEHYEYYCSKKDFVDLLPKLPTIFDEPFADASALPTVLLAMKAKEIVDVALSADGGDEVFGGYNKYINIKKFQDFKDKYISKNIQRCIGYSSNVLDKFLTEIPSLRRKNEKFQEMLDAEHIGDVLMSAGSIFTNKELSEMMMSAPDLPKTNFSNPIVGNKIPLYDSLMSIDFMTYMVDDVLVKVDRATMAFSLESREPLLDYRIIELLATADPNDKILNDNLKIILKTITHKYVPKELVDRPKKGFALPVVELFRSEFVDYLNEYLNEKELALHNLFSIEMISSYKKKFINGDNFYANKLWALLMFQMWYKIWIDGKS